MTRKVCLKKGDKRSYAFPIKLAIGSLILGFVVLALKGLAYWITGSVALLSDALESIVNVVSAVLALCDRSGVPVVTHGGRTGLARGATSARGQIVLATNRFDRLDIDPVERVATVGAGVTLQATCDE